MAVLYISLQGERFCSRQCNEHTAIEEENPDKMEVEGNEKIN